MGIYWESIKFGWQVKGKCLFCCWFYLEGRMLCFNARKHLQGQIYFPGWFACRLLIWVFSNTFINLRELLTSLNQNQCLERGGFF